jgi:hypothetical protein
MPRAQMSWDSQSYCPRVDVAASVSSKVEKTDNDEDPQTLFAKSKIFGRISIVSVTRG